MTEFSIEQVGNDFRVVQKPIATGVTSPWKWLTEEEITETAKWADKHARDSWHLEFARAIQRKVKEKNQ
jgi:hypothetical protein